MFRRGGNRYSFLLFFTLLCFLVPLPIAGCRFLGFGNKTDSTVKPEGSMGSVPDANAAAAKAAADKEAAEKLRLSKIKGYNSSIQSANAANTDPVAKGMIEREAKGQESLLTDVPVDEKTRKEGSARIEAAKSGDTDKADKLLIEALQNNGNYLRQIAELTVKADQTREDLTNKIKLKEDELLKNKEANQKKIDALVSSFQQQIGDMEVGYAVKWAVGLGTLFVLLGVAGFALCIYTGLGLKLQNIVACGVLVLAGGGCYATAPFLAHKWVPYVVGGVILLGFAGVLVYFFVEMRRHLKEKDGHAEAKEVIQSEYDLLRATTAHIVDQLEKAPLEKTKEIFASLDGAMDKPMKKLVAEIKSERPSKGLAST